MIEIIEILGRSKQGITEPFLYLAFDTNLSGKGDFASHVFASHFHQILGDLIERRHREKRMAEALPAFNEACDNSPETW